MDRIRAFDENMRVGDRKLLSWARNERGEWKTEFEEWFKESVIKDEKGDPLIFYHGTNKEFDSFSSEHVQEFGFHFGSTYSAADRAIGDNSRVFPVVLSIKHPLRLHDTGSFSWGKYRLAYLGALIEEVCDKEDKQCVNLISEKVFAADTNDKRIAVLTEFGFDGVIYSNDFEGIGAGDSLIALQSSQVRSATTGEYLWKQTI